MKFTPPIGAKLRDDDAERVRRNHEERVTQIQKVPILGGVEILDQELPDGVDVYISHGLKRRARCFVSPPRGGSASGSINDRTVAIEADRNRYIVLRADDWGATVKVDLWIW